MLEGARIVVIAQDLPVIVVAVGQVIDNIIYIAGISDVCVAYVDEVF